MKRLLITSVALATTLLATSSLAQSGGACLQNNQVFYASALDDHTLIVNDRSGKTYVVQLNGECNGLTTAPWRINFHSTTNQACLGPGDRISFRHRSVGRNTCFINGVSTDLVSVASIANSPRPFSRAN